MLKITNLEDRLVTITWAKQDYPFDPGETLPIPEHVYHHWFGDPALLASDDIKVAREERMRVDALWGEPGIPKLVPSTEAAKLRAAAVGAPVEEPKEEGQEPEEVEEGQGEPESEEKPEPEPKGSRSKDSKPAKAEKPEKPEEEEAFPKHPDKK